ncbi:MAG: hypothetical protein M3O50_04085 [Myxococcota bacterium]|nr:hypothetical protein [Myxococcota bacterium]
MLKAPVTISRGVLHRWPIIAFAATFAAFYIAWLILFERWFEPCLRRWSGVIIGRTIAWLPAGGPFRAWGLSERGPRALEATVGLLGTATVILSAFLPSVGAIIAAIVYANEPAIRASVYLMSLPLTMLFVFRVLTRPIPRDQLRP